MTRLTVLLEDILSTIVAAWGNKRRKKLVEAGFFFLISCDLQTDVVLSGPTAVRLM